MNEGQIAIAPKEDEARVNVTWAGQNGDLPDPVHRDAPDADVKAWAMEAVRAGDVPGVVGPDANFSDFVVDRFDASDARPYNLIQVRPKTPFGRVRVRVRVGDWDFGER